MEKYQQNFRQLNLDSLVKRFYSISTDEKYELLHYLSEQSIKPGIKEVFIYLSSHTNKYLRNEIFDIMSTFPFDSNMKLTFIKALQDREELIRVCAVEKMGEQKVHSEVSTLIRMLNDKSFLVRGNAAVSLAQIGDRKGESAIRKRSKFERNHWVKLNLNAAMYLFGEHQKLLKIIKFLGYISYRVRCAAANILSSISNEGNKELILVALENQLKIEKTKAALSTIEEAIKNLNFN